MSDIIKFKAKAATDHKWRPITAEEGRMAFEYYSIQEQRILDLESGAADITPDEDSAIRKLFMSEMGIKDADAINEAARKDAERIQKKIENKSKF